MLLSAIILSMVACAPAASDDGDNDDSAEVVEPACPYDTSDWYDSIGFLHLFAEDDGTLAYDPPGDLMVSRDGTYEAATGEFEALSSYVDGYKYVTRVSSGTVRIEDDGDFEAGYERTTIDVLDVERSAALAIVQTGCLSEAEITNLGDPGGYAATYIWYSETVSATQIVQDLETALYDEPYLEQRVTWSDFTQDYTIDWKDGDYVATGTYFSDGTHSRESSSLSDDSYTVSTIDWEADGSYHYYYERYLYDGGELDGIFDVYYNYDGSGEGTYTIFILGEKVVCEYERDPLAQEDCTYTVTCDDGETSVYDC